MPLRECHAFNMELLDKERVRNQFFCPSMEVGDEKEPQRLRSVKRSSLLLFMQRKGKRSTGDQLK